MFFSNTSEYISFILVFTTFSHHVQCGKRSIPQLLVISFDGFRWDYVNRYSTPTFDFIGNSGVHAPFGLRTVFITKTFPSHWTIATGLYAESHGIIDNSFYDPVFNETFYKNLKDPKWWNGQPIWVTAKTQGKKTGVYFWPGSEVKIEGVYADFWRHYSSFESPQKQVDTVVNWLLDTNVDMAMVYFSQPDKSGHEYGAFSLEVENAVKSSDNLVLNLIDQLSSEYFDNINVLILSDHGMTNLTVGSDQQILLGNYIDLDKDVIDVPQSGSMAGVIPARGRLMSVYEKLKNAHPNMTVYLKDDIPVRYHYKNNQRITPIIAIADEGFVIYREHTINTDVGNHGYDNELDSMNPIFYARGPDFKKNITTDMFETVNIYPLMCHILRITPAPNNGSIHNLTHILTEESRQRIVTKSLAPFSNQLSRALITMTSFALLWVSNQRIY